jgi:hypothetical protein
MDAQYNPRKRTESKWDDNEEDVKDDFNDWMRVEDLRVFCTKV